MRITTVLMVLGIVLAAISLQSCSTSTRTPAEACTKKTQDGSCSGEAGNETPLHLSGKALR